MTLTQLRYLVAVVDAGNNITQAAIKVHATQPGLSKQLKQLEQWLGFELFARRGKALDGLTEPGARVVEQARALLERADAIRGIKASFSVDQGGALRIATTHTQARYVLPKAIVALKRSWPLLDVQLTPLDDDVAIGALQSGAADVAVVSAPHAPPDLLALPLYRWGRHALVPADHALAKVPLTLAELARFPQVSYASALSATGSLRVAMENAGLQLVVGMAASDGDLIKTYVRAGLGVGIIAPMALTNDDADLTARSLGGVLPMMTTWLVLRPQQTLTRALAALLEHLAPHVDPWAVKQRLLGDAHVDLLKGEVPEWNRAPAVEIAKAA